MFTPKRYHYFSHELNREVVELYWNTALFNLAINLTYIFEPIFLYNLGFTLPQIMFFYVIVYTTYALLILPITKITSRIGYKHAIFISTIVYVFYWSLLYQVKYYPALFFLVPILFGIQKSFFWPPYNADISISNIKGQRGREVGMLFSVVELVAIVGPILGGFISYQFGFPILFSVAAFLMMASVFPLFQTPEIYTKHRFHFKNFWSIVRRYPYNFFGYWGYAEDLMLMSLWPIFMFMLVPQVLSVGIIITFASLIAVVVMLYLGRLLDRFKDAPFLQIAAIGYGFSWLFRTFASGIGSVVAFDTVTRLGKAAVNVPLLFQTFQLGGEKGPDYAIAYAVFFEFSLAIGKILTALLAIWILTASGSIPTVFVMAGVLTMFYALVRKR
ncbi:MAG: MFS transporter [Candidatus Doudnabacteria bacterium]|nr:MFS transporter [Candidatus Doudnabacteria bacterium]